MSKGRVKKASKCYKKPHSEPKKGAKAFRNLAVTLKAVTGAGVDEIAKEMGVSRCTVSRIVNSDEARAVLHSINTRLLAGIDDAIATVLLAVKTDFLAARDLLRHHGAMSASVKIAHSGVFTLEEMIAGSNDDSKKDDDSKKENK